MADDIRTLGLDWGAFWDLTVARDVEAEGGWGKGSAGGTSLDAAVETGTGFSTAADATFFGDFSLDLCDFVSCSELSPPPRP